MKNIPHTLLLSYFFLISSGGPSHVYNIISRILGTKHYNIQYKINTGDDTVNLTKPGLILDAKTEH
jgi:hypothetical protein